MKRKKRTGTVPFFASVTLHLVALLIVVSFQASSIQRLEPVPIRIQLYSPPPAQLAPEPQPLPEEAVTVEVPDPPQIVDPLPQEPAEQRPTPTPEPLEQPETSQPAGDPKPTESDGGEDLDVQMEGLAASFPEYFGNIVLQIRRCLEFNGPPGLKTVVRFYITRDGTVDMDLFRYTEWSGDSGFDRSVKGAVECAGEGRFGPLPEAMGLDRFLVEFEVESAGRISPG